MAGNRGNGYCGIILRFFLSALFCRCFCILRNICFSFGGLTLSLSGLGSFRLGFAALRLSLACLTLGFLTFSALSCILRFFCLRRFLCSLGNRSLFWSGALSRRQRLSRRLLRFALLGGGVFVSGADGKVSSGFEMILLSSSPNLSS